MGYTVRDSSSKLKFLEEKKDDGEGGSRDNELRDRVDDAKQPPAPTNEEASSLAAASSSPEDSDHDVVTANEPSDMVLQDPEEQAQQGSPSTSSHALPTSEEATAAMQQFQSHLAAQQLLEHAVAASQAQQTQLMTSSLGSLQLGSPSALLPQVLAGQVMGVPSPVVPHVVPSAPATAVQAAHQIQQQVLAQQQAAAQAAALTIGAVTSGQAGVPGALFAPGSQHLTPSMSPALLQSAPAQALAPALAALNPIAAAPLLSALSPTTNPAMALVPGTQAVSPATLPTATATAHPLAPQMTIPHYVPPIPPTWGAQIPALSVQDRPLVPPIYNGINPNYPGAQLLHAHPPIFAVDNFLTPAECDFLIDASNDALGPAPVVGKGSGEVSPSRTSSTCYLAREDLPEYLRKVSLLTGKPAEHCELPQVGRYLPSQQYLQHFDAFDLSNDDGRRFAANGGQRTVTVLVYLNDVPRGGSTAFPNLNLEVRPRRGMALVFFPSTLDGLLDRMTLHAALPAVDIKYVSQVWIRQGNYEGRPSKRLAEPMVAGLQERREAAQKLLMGQIQQQQLAAAQAQLQQQQGPHLAQEQQLAAHAQVQQQNHQAVQQLQQQHQVAAAQQMQQNYQAAAQHLQQQENQQMSG